LSTQIDIDAKGVARIAGTGYKVRLIVEEWLFTRCTPEQIHEQHPDLTMAQIHCAFAYYYENRAMIDDEIERKHREAEALLVELSDPVLRQKLIDAKRSAQTS
jgi:uncharacterized protein (DUF433 family)